MDVTVFYAWQSDRPEKLNHYLIRDAAKNACDRITADLSNDWTVTLDSDTKDSPGMCDIPNTILAKIRNCDIFLADLTLVGKTEAGKLLPNSNVVFELGYAAKTLGFKALIGVVNEAFGELESQVFDIKRRRGLGYTAKSAMGKPELKKETDKLSKDLEKIIRGTIQKVVLRRRGKVVSGEAQSAAVKQDDFAKRVLEGKFHGLTDTPTVVTSFFFAPQSHLEYEKIGDAVREHFWANPEVDSDAYTWESDKTITEFSLSGYLQRACIKDFSSMVSPQDILSKAPPSDQCYVRAQSLHWNIVRGVMAVSRFLNRLQIKTPWHIAISLVGMNGYMPLDDAGNAARRPIGKDILHLPVLRVSKTAQVEDGMQTGHVLKPALEFLTRSVGWEFNWYYTETGLFNLRV
jgi:hypothetical protein